METITGRRSNSQLLKRSLKVLGMSGKDLAQKLSDYRDDEKTTSEATVSRWVRGGSPVEPAVMGWMEALIRIKAKEEIKSYIKMPASESLVIFVGCPKGGVGVSSIAQALAVVAHRDFGSDTLHLMVDSHSDYVAQRMEKLMMTSISITHEQLLRFKPKPGQIVICDMARDISHNARQGDQENAFASMVPDVVLIPAKCESQEDIRHIRPMLDNVDFKCPVKLLHLADFGSLDAFSNAQDEGLDITSDIFIDRMMLMYRGSGREFLPSSFFDKWKSEYHHEYYRYLLTQLIEASGGEVVGDESDSCSLEMAPFEEILSVLEAKMK